jgi:hypothetical protein
VHRLALDNKQLYVFKYCSTQLSATRAYTAAQTWTSISNWLPLTS